MTTANTALLGLALPVVGTEIGTWGTDVNVGITTFLEASVAGTNAMSITGTDASLSVTNYPAALTQGIAGSSNYAILVLSGAMTANRNLFLPNSSKTYVILNSCTGGFTIQVRGVSGPTAGVQIVNGEYVMVAWNGSDFVKVSDMNGALTPTTIAATSTISAVGSITSAGSIISTAGALQAGSSGSLFYDAGGGASTIRSSNGVGGYVYATLSNAGVFTVNSVATLTAGNYNSYAPTLTGTGASGTWVINITGTAAAASVANALNTSNNYTMQALTATTGSFSGNVSMPSYTVTSDRRLKSDITPLEFFSEIVDATKVYEYTKDGRRQFGMIAQEAKKVVPLMVHKDKKTKMLGIEMGGYIPIMMAELKALRARVKKLEGKK